MIKTVYYIKQRRLACAVRPYQPENFAFSEFEGNILDSGKTAEKAGNFFYFEKPHDTPQLAS